MKKKQETKKPIVKQAKAASVAAKTAAPAHRVADPRKLQKTYVSLPLKQTEKIDKLAAKHKVSKAEIHRRLISAALKNVKAIF